MDLDQKKSVELGQRELYSIVQALPGLNQKKSVELSQRELYNIVQALPGLIRELEMQEIMSKNDKTPKKYTKEIESMEKLKKRLEGKLDFKLDWNQGQIRTIKDNLNWSSLRDNDIFVEILIEKMDPKGISLFWHRKEDPNT